MCCIFKQPEALLSDSLLCNKACITHMRTRFFSIILLIWSIWFSVGVSAQTLTADLHKPLPTDSLLAYKIPYIQVTDTGRNCVWDFSDISTDTAEIIPVDYFALSTTDTTRIGLHRERTNYYYRYAQDTLWLAEYETSRTHVCYVSPMPLLRYPFEYGDSLNSTFEGRGQYCHLVPLSVQGSIQIHADAMGTLKLPELVIDSALRIHSRILYKTMMHDTAHVVNDLYRWYSKNMRYPLLETTKIVVVKNIDTIEIAQAYYIPQDTEINASQRNIQSLIQEVTDSLVTEISCMPNPVHSNLYISYQLNVSADVYISIHYNGGALMYSTSMFKQEMGSYDMVVNMSSFPVGAYVVYIHANDEIFGTTIIKI